MLIECKIRRKHGTVVELYGQAYHFLPNAAGEHVCEVKDPEAIRRFFEIANGTVYVKASGGPALPAKPIEEPSETKFILPAGAPVNVDEMTREQLFQYARNIGIRTPHPKISDDKLKLNIKLALAERLADDDLPEDESEDEPGDEDGED